jgi:hypothetical protein
VSKKGKPALTLPKKDDLLALVERAQDGDQTALPALREVLKDPALVDALGGNLATQVQYRLINQFSGGNLLFKETVTRKMERLRAELAGPEPTPLEHLLAERIASCWLHLHHLEIIYAGKDSFSLDLGMYYQKAIDRAHRRYLSAIKALATVRKLALPALQVNVARKQVNIAGAGGPSNG